MIAELSHFLLIAAFAVLILQASLPFVARFSSDHGLLAVSQQCALIQAMCISLSFFGLMYAFVMNDFSVWYVSANSSQALPIWYRWCAVWGAHEGSMMLWLFLFSLWTLAASRCQRAMPDKDMSHLLAVLACIGIAFVAFILFTSNPFVRTFPVVPDHGRDLNSLLQDPGFLIHPPMLYMGYVGCSIGFASVIVSLIKGEFTQLNANWLRSWVTTTWLFLTFGILLGSWWSYHVLGWGGWWAWDPVENASLLPWLVTTALLHSVILTSKRNVLHGFTILLAITAFALSLLGTFLVRSGVLTSVHAFAVDPSRGIFILMILCVTICGSLSLFALRVNRVSQALRFALWSRETAMLLGNVILFVLMLTILLGTTYPLFIDALGLGKLSVGAPYYNLVVIPIAIPLIVLMAVGPNMSWALSPIEELRILKMPATLCLAIGLCLTLGFSLAPNISLACSLVIWVIWGNIIALVKKSKVGPPPVAMFLAHIGMAVFIIGVTFSSAFEEQRFIKISQGEQITIGPYHLRYVGADVAQGPNYRAQQIVFALQEQGTEPRHLTAEKRFFHQQQMPISLPAIQTQFFSDLYIALGQPLSANSWSIRVFYKPFVRFIWYGPLLMVLAAVWQRLGAANFLRKRFKIDERDYVAE